MTIVKEASGNSPINEAEQSILVNELIGRALFVNVFIPYASFVAGTYAGQLSIDNNKNKYEWANGYWIQIGSGGAAYVADVGLPNARSNRYFAPGAALNAHPGDDTQCITFFQFENIRFYRLKLTGGAVGDYFKYTEDAVNGTQEALQLDDPTSSASTNVPHQRLYTSNPDAESVYDQGWTDWKAINYDASLPSLSRLGFEASTNATDYKLYMEGK